MSTAAGRSAGNCRVSALSASTPPIDAPMTMISRVLMGSARKKALAVARSGPFDRGRAVNKRPFRRRPFDPIVSLLWSPLYQDPARSSVLTNALEQHCRLNGDALPVKALMLDVDGVLVDGRPEDGRHWHTSIEEDLGLSR